MNIVLVIGLLLLEAGIILLWLVPKVKRVETYNSEIEEKNKAVAKDLVELEERRNAVYNDYNSIHSAYSTLLEQFSTLKVNADAQADNYYNKAMENAKLRAEQDASALQQQLISAKEHYVEEYTTVMKDLTDEYNNKYKTINQVLESQQALLDKLNEQVDDEQKIVNSAVEANKRAMEMSEKKNFFKINISETDKAEIAQLRECFSHLRNPEPLNKVIWKVYYENPANDMIGRVVGSGVHTGIYKITNTINNMCYVGQSVNLADRFKQHLKRGCGADAPTKNKLYPAMNAVGIENFTFEVIEECDAGRLSEREKFWTDYFKAQEFGYSIRKG